MVKHIHLRDINFIDWSFQSALWLSEFCTTLFHVVYTAVFKTVISKASCIISLTAVDQQLSRVQQTWQFLIRNHWTLEAFAYFGSASLLDLSTYSRRRAACSFISSLISASISRADTLQLQVICLDRLWMRVWWSKNTFLNTFRLLYFPKFHYNTALFFLEYFLI
jgi:hypothetical protein